MIQDFYKDCVDDVDVDIVRAAINLLFQLSEERNHRLIDTCDRAVNFDGNVEICFDGFFFSAELPVDNDWDNDWGNGF